MCAVPAIFFELIVARDVHIAISTAGQHIVSCQKRTSHGLSSPVSTAGRGVKERFAFLASPVTLPVGSLFPLHGLHDGLVLAVLHQGQVLD